MSNDHQPNRLKVRQNHLIIYSENWILIQNVNRKISFATWNTYRKRNKIYHNLLQREALIGAPNITEILGIFGDIRTFGDIKPAIWGSPLYEITTLL